MVDAFHRTALAAGARDNGGPGVHPVFIGLVLTIGRHYLGHQAGVAIVVDSVMVAIFAVYLLTARY